MFQYFLEEHKKKQIAVLIDMLDLTTCFIIDLSITECVSVHTNDNILIPGNCYFYQILEKPEKRRYLTRSMTSICSITFSSLGFRVLQ